MKIDKKTNPKRKLFLLSILYRFEVDVGSIWGSKNWLKINIFRKQRRYEDVLGSIIASETLLGWILKPSGLDFGRFWAFGSRVLVPSGRLWMILHPKGEQNEATME